MARRMRGLAELAALICATAIGLSGGGPAASAERNPIFEYNGNRYIIRAQQSGGALYLRAYRAAGSAVWEPFGTATLPAGSSQQHRKSLKAQSGRGSIVERIYFTGRPLGYSTVDLDNPLNTQLYRAPEGSSWD